MGHVQPRSDAAIGACAIRNGLGARSDGPPNDCLGRSAACGIPGRGWLARDSQGSRVGDDSLDEVDRVWRRRPSSLLLKCPALQGREDGLGESEGQWSPSGRGTPRRLTEGTDEEKHRKRNGPSAKLGLERGVPE